MTGSYERSAAKKIAFEMLNAPWRKMRPLVATFQANVPERIRSSARTPPFFENLPSQKQSFYAPVLTMPVYFMTLPLNEEDADGGTTEINNEPGPVSWLHCGHSLYS